MSFAGAATSGWAPAEKIGGRYRENWYVGQVAQDQLAIKAMSEGVREYALDPRTAEALWTKSEELVAESF